MESHLLWGHIDIHLYLLYYKISDFKYNSLESNHLAASSEHVHVSHRRLAVWLCGLIQQRPAGLEATEDLLCWGNPMFHNTSKQTNKNKITLKCSIRLITVMAFGLIAACSPVPVDFSTSSTNMGEKRNTANCRSPQQGKRTLHKPAHHYKINVAHNLGWIMVLGDAAAFRELLHTVGMK